MTRGNRRPVGPGAASRTPLTAAPTTAELPPQVQPPSIVGWRVAQFLVDLGVVTLLCYLATLLMMLLPKAPDGTYVSPLATLAMSFVVLVVGIAVNVWYWVFLPARHAGQTLGMRLFRLQVAAVDGGSPTRTQLALRMIMLAADCMFMGLVGLAAMLSSPRRQRLGDMVASTRVTHVSGLAGYRAASRAHRGRPAPDPGEQLDVPATGSVNPSWETPASPLGRPEPGVAQS